MTLAVDPSELRENVVERRNFLMPSIKLDDQKFEFIFLLDRSGSMSGSKMNLARRALLLILRSLPVTCRFNIFGFGDNFDRYYHSSVLYNQETVDDASEYAKKIEADLGGTALYPPMATIYGLEQTPEFLTQIFIITDGESIDQERVMQLVEQNSTFARVFSLGIGLDVDRPFIEKIAVAGGGVAEFVTPAEEKIETKVLAQLSLSLKPSFLEPILLD